MARRKTNMERFAAKVSVGGGDDPCHVWTASKFRGGYGCFWTGEHRFYNSGYGPVTMTAHRWIWEHTNGKVPDGLYVLHRCDNPSCVNVEHLFIGTQSDNVQDSANKGRHGHLKLTPEQRQEIADLWQEGRLTQPQIAARYGVTQATVSRVAARAKLSPPSLRLIA